MVKTNRLGTLAAAGGALGAVGLLMLLMLVVGVQPSEATFPGKNGRIVFERQQWLGPLVGYGPVKIFAIRPDATGLKRVTKGSTPNFSPNGRRIAFVRLDQFGVEDIYIKSPWDTGKVRNVTKTQNSYELSPAWSPDGRQIAFERRGEIYKINADGTNERRLTELDTRARDFEPSWSPDGSQIVFVRYENDQTTGEFFIDLFVMNADGTGERRLTDRVPPNCNRLSPDWSPDGNKVVFEYICNAVGNGIYVVNADGTGQQRLTNTLDLDPVWSPNGRQIAYISANAGFYDLYVMLADGTNPTKITNSPEVDEQNPSWQPKPLSDG